MKYPSLIASALLSCAISAQAAETVFINGFTFNPFGAPLALATDIPTNFISTIVVTGANPVPPPAGTYTGAGQMSGFLNGNSFVAYCVQINVLVGFGITYTDYNLIGGGVGFPGRDADLAKLLTWAGAGAPADAAQSAALQAAVWEIVHETNAGAYSFAAGKLSTSSNSVATQAALGNIETNWATIMAITPTYAVSRLDGAAQDLLIFAPVPVPEAGTLALMTLGLVGLGVVARRRRQS